MNLASSINEYDLQQVVEKDNREVFEYFYSKYSALIYGIIYKGVGSEVRASVIFQEIFTTAWNKICDGEISVSNCFGCLLALSRQHLAEVLSSDKFYRDEKTKMNSKTIFQMSLTTGYSLEEIANKLNLSCNEARLELRATLKKTIN